MIPTLSIVILSKNEEERLPRLLASIPESDDIEIVLADTGSTDSTVAIGRSDPRVLICHILWNDHFSEARNSGAQHATGKWMLWADCDMYFDVDSGKALLLLVAQLKNDGIGCDAPDGYNVVVKVTSSGAACNSPRIIVRSVPFRGRVHEVPQVSLTADPPTPIVFSHDRDLDSEGLVARDARYERLLRLDIAEDPKNAIQFTYLADILFRRGDFTGAADVMRKKGRDRLNHRDVSYLAAELIALGKYHLAIEMCHDGLRLFKYDARLHILAGNACTDMRDYQEALKWYNKAMRLDPAKQLQSILMASDEEYQVASRMNAAFVYAETGYRSKAIGLLNECLTLCPQTPQRAVIEMNLTKIKQNHESPKGS